MIEFWEGHFIGNQQPTGLFLVGGIGPAATVYPSFPIHILAEFFQEEGQFRKAVGISHFFAIHNFPEGIATFMSSYGNTALGISITIAIAMHNIPEGIVTFIVSKNNIMLGISICIAIALHNIPEGISIAVPIYYSSKSKFKAIFYTFLAGMSEPIGALLTGLFLVNFVNDIVLGLLFSFIAGVMIQIGSFKLLPTGKDYNKRISWIFFLFGFTVMIISHILM